MHSLFFNQQKEALTRPSPKPNLGAGPYLFVSTTLHYVCILIYYWFLIEDIFAPPPSNVK